MEDNQIPQQAPKKSKKGLIGTIVGVLVVALLGGGGWYAYDQGLFEGEDSPPTLEIGGSKFQGRSITDYGNYLKYDAEDVAKHTATADAKFKLTGNAVQYFSAAEALSAENILGSVIKPTDGLRVLLAVYKDGCYSLYPSGPFKIDPDAKNCSDLIPEDKLTDFVIPKNTGFAIMSDKGFEFDSNLMRSSQTFADSFDVATSVNSTGWILLPAATNVDLTDPKIINAFKQTADNDFAKINDPAGYDAAAEKYKMIWVKVDPTQIAKVVEEEAEELECPEGQAIVTVCYDGLDADGNMTGGCVKECGPELVEGETGVVSPLPTAVENAAKATEDSPLSELKQDDLAQDKEIIDKTAAATDDSNVDVIERRPASDNNFSISDLENFVKVPAPKLPPTEEEITAAQIFADEAKTFADAAEDSLLSIDGMEDENEYYQVKGFRDDALLASTSAQTAADVGDSQTAEVELTKAKVAADKAESLALELINLNK